MCGFQLRADRHCPKTAARVAEFRGRRMALIDSDLAGPPTVRHTSATSKRHMSMVKQQRQACLKWLVLSLALSTPGWGATLTVAPATVSNTFDGTFSITVAGLTDGEPVRLEKFRDANANGNIDPGEWLVASFSLRDG
jgi:hypothetical protein